MKHTIFFYLLLFVLISSCSNSTGTSEDISKGNALIYAKINAVDYSKNIIQLDNITYHEKPDDLSLPNSFWTIPKNKNVLDEAKRNIKNYRMIEIKPDTQIVLIKIF